MHFGNDLFLSHDCSGEHNHPFDIYTYSPDYQVRAFIIQDGQPVAYYSCNLSSAQKNTTMKKELLAIVIVFIEFCSMLLGAKLSIFTDHNNLTFSNFNTQRVLRWRCFVEECSPRLYHLVKNERLGGRILSPPSLESFLC